MSKIVSFILGKEGVENNKTKKKIYITLLIIIALTIFSNTTIRNEIVVAQGGADPRWQDNKTSVISGSQYLPERNYGFQINWTDPQGNLDNVTFETNLTAGSTLENITKADIDKYTSFMNNSVGIWWINFTQEQLAGAGNYAFRWYANDTNSNENSTDQWKYVIEKNGSTDIDLYVNGEQSDKTIEQYQNVNFTIVLNVPTSGVVRLHTNFSDDSYKLWDSGSCPPQFENMTNMTNLGNWTWKANFTNSNYTTATKNWYVKVTPFKKEVNITIYNSTGDMSNAYIRVYNSSNDVVSSGVGELSANLEQYRNYSLEMTEKINSENLTVKIVNLNITSSFNRTSQTVKDYSEELPSGFNKITTIFAFNDSGLSYSYATIYIPNESFTVTNIFHCKDAWNYTEGLCQNVADWEINDTADYNAKSNETYVFFNVTSFDGYGGGGDVYLEVNLVLPPGDTLIERYDIFDVNATVYCRGGACSDVYGTVQYNLSSSNPDTPVNVTYSDVPLFIDESSPAAKKACPTNQLEENEFCNITWRINATGSIDSAWKLGVLFNSSDTNIEDNHTDNVTLTIAPCIEEIAIQFSNISFGTVLPHTVGNAALKNSDDLYNVTNYGTCTSNIWIKSTNLVKGSNYILYSNISFNNVTDDFGSSYRISNSFSQGNSTFKKDVPGSTNATGYYFLDVPIVYAGEYEGNITFCLNSSLRPTLC